VLKDNFRVSILECMMVKDASVVEKLLKSMNMYFKETGDKDKFTFVRRKKDLT